MPESAFYTSSTKVHAAWQDHMEAQRKTHACRKALIERIGRNLMISRSSLGHQTSVVGFEHLEGDQRGDLLAEGALRVMANGEVRPNLRRKAGQELAKEMAHLSMPGIDLPGMPAFLIKGGVGGLYSHRPSLFVAQEDVWAYWGCELTDNEVDLEIWSQAPMSAYHLVLESREDRDA